MAIRKIVVQGDDILTKVCRPVTDFNKRLHDLLDDMVETLTEVGGAGLAAPQVGILRRAVIVMDDDDTPIELVNPEIVSSSGEQRSPEGCLSIPGISLPPLASFAIRAGSFTNLSYSHISQSVRSHRSFQVAQPQLLAR